MKFVDASFWIALQCDRDQNHAAAHALGDQEQGPLITTHHVVGETWTFMRKWSGHSGAVEALQRIRAVPTLTIVHVDAEEEADAWRWLNRRGEREYSFVDATSFAVMRRRRIGEALAFDGDFTAAGFVELRP